MSDGVLLGQLVVIWWKRWWRKDDDDCITVVARRYGNLISNSHRDSFRFLLRFFLFFAEFLLKFSFYFLHCQFHFFFSFLSFFVVFSLRNFTEPFYSKGRRRQRDLFFFFFALTRKKENWGFEKSCDGHAGASMRYGNILCRFGLVYNTNLVARSDESAETAKGAAQDNKPPSSSFFFVYVCMWM